MNQLFTKMNDFHIQSEFSPHERIFSPRPLSATNIKYGLTLPDPVSTLFGFYQNKYKLLLYKNAYKARKMQCWRCNNLKTWILFIHHQRLQVTSRLVRKIFIKRRSSFSWQTHPFPALSHMVVATFYFERIQSTCAARGEENPHKQKAIVF